MAVLQLGVGWHQSLSVAILGFWSCVLTVQFIATAYGKWRLYRKSSSDEECLTLPGVSIIKPIGGMDANLEQNLESFFKLDYPKFELLLCVQDEFLTDVIAIVKNLLGKYPKVDAQLFIGAETVGVNPKINNMYSAYTNCKYELVMISDQGLKIMEDTLTDMVCTMKRDVGLVHQVPYMCDGEGNSFARTLEKVFFGTQHARIYLAGNCLGFNVMTGMSCVIRKCVVDDIGGIKTFAEYIAEDYFLGKEIHRRGWAMRVSSQPAMQNPGNSSVAKFQARMIRWMKLRFAQMPSTILLEPLIESVVLGPLAAAAVYTLFQWNPVIFLIGHFVIWCLTDYILVRIMQGGPLPFSFPQYIKAWLFRETSGLFLNFRAHCNPIVDWGTRQYRLQWGGKAVEVGKSTMNGKSNGSSNGYSMPLGKVMPD